MEKRPAVMLALDAAQIDRDLAFEFGIDGLAEIMAQQDIFGRDRRVGLEFEHPMAVRLLHLQQRIGCPLDGAGREPRAK